MAKGIRKIAIAATPTAPLLSHLIHALSHNSEFEVTVLTRETNVSLPGTNSHAHHDHDHSNGHNHDHKHEHEHHSQITHVKTSFSESELKDLLSGKDILICTLTGSDLHLSAPLIDAASSSKIQLFIPSEYGLDTSNAKIRDLLPPYRTRYEIQEKLRKSGMSWKAIYSGIVLEDAMKTDGVLGIDVMWSSAVIFPGSEKSKVAISTYPDIADRIVESLDGEVKGSGEEIYPSSFRVTINDIVQVAEEELDRTVDRYEGNLEGARKEAAERMKMGYFDGGVALMGRVAAWDPSIDAWAAWKDGEGARQGEWKDEVKRAVRMVRDGKIGGDGCGC